MSQFDEIRLYCEDEENRPTVRLLFIALNTLSNEVPVARTIDPRPTGSKEDVKSRVRHARRDRTRAFGVCDRDFLERTLVDDRRRKAFHADSRMAEAWPLSRHAIESYLLDPPFLAEALPHRNEAEWKAVLAELAEARKWSDLVRATLTDLRWRLSRVKWPTTDLLLASKEEALAEISSRFRDNRTEIETALKEEDASAKFASLERDFVADGPLAQRVDGRELLNALDKRLVLEGARHARGLLGTLLMYAERHACPRALLDDLRPLLVEMEAARAIWS